MSSTAELIKERLSIVEVVGSYIKLEGAGANFKAKCPFHNERSPSFFVSPARGSYYCFGCSAKGDIFSFVQEYEKIDFLGALKILAERAGVELREFKTESRNKQDRQYKVIDAVCAYFQKNLSESRNAGPRSYLIDRGLTDESIHAWRVGYAEDGWRHMMDTLLRLTIDGAPVTEQDLLDVGVIKKTEAEQPGEQGPKGRDKIYDRFRSRIMFPIFDTSGRVIAFSGRIYGKEDSAGGPKYLNSPDMELFNKSEALYGFDKAKQGMREWGYVVLVEGQMDLLMSHQVGVKNAVATSGTSLTSLHLQKIARMTKNIMFMYDSDNAGFNATRRGEKLAIELGFDVKVVTLPHGEDPASLIKKDKQQFIEALKRSTGVIEYHLDMLLKKYPDTHERLKAIEEQLVPDLALIPSAIRRSELITLASIKSQIPEKALTEEVEKVRATLPTDQGSIEFHTPHESGQLSTSTSTSSRMSSGNTGQSAPSDRTGLHGLRQSSASTSTPTLDLTLRRIIALLLYIEHQKGKDYGTPFEQQLNQIIQEDDKALIASLRETQTNELLFEAEMLFGGDIAHLERNFNEHLLELEKRSLNHLLMSYMSELGLAEKAKNKVKSDEITQKCQEILLKLSELEKRRQHYFKK